MKYWKILVILFFLINISFAFEENTTNNNMLVTNITGEISTESRLPNIYLKDQTNTNQTETLSTGKRFDAVYFISVPVTYYLTFNLLQQKNWYLRQSFSLDKSDEVFL
ncbi:MAG: hypothetical protein N2258_08735, partial [Brevinematales bacterium]|nr:hypothetical protein [Brevinematales bacterium]